MAFRYSPKIITNGLILYYDGANPKCYVSGDTVSNDLSITQSTGTLTNGVTYDTDNNGSWVFDGIDDYIDCTNNAAFNQDFDTAFSVSAWVKFDTIATVNILFYKFNPSPKGWQLRLQNNKVSLFLKHATGGANQIHAFGTTIINIGSWYHLTATYDGSNTLAGVKLYVNGASDVVTGAGGPVVGTFQNTEPLLLGITTNGNIASFKMWNRELTQEEVLQNYNAMKSRFGL